MKSQVLHTVWCSISGEAAGEIWNWALLGVKGLKVESVTSELVSVIQIASRISTLSRLSFFMRIALFFIAQTFTLVKSQNVAKELNN